MPEEMIREVQNFNIEQVKKWINPENYDKIKEYIENDIQ